MNTLPCTADNIQRTSKHRDVVLIVDDTPANLAYLSDALDEAGYKVLVSIDGATALKTLLHTTPDIILLDAMMPGMDGFETCKAVKNISSCADTPIVFMTALVDTHHVVQAFEAGAIDYVTKPVRHEEVLARVATHVERARVLRKTQQSIEACGRASMTIDASGNITWQTARVRQWLMEYCDEQSSPYHWKRLRSWMSQLAEGGMQHSDAMLQFSLTRQQGRLTIHYAGRITHDEHLLLLQENRTDISAQRLSSGLKLTTRESEVLHWLAAGKTDRDIAEILGMAPRTVNKHLEHIYVKLGVETRAAAAAMASTVMAAPVSQAL
ncbi:MAG: response regulator transcription factor [Steroidobacter sp.]